MAETIEMLNTQPVVLPETAPPLELLSPAAAADAAMTELASAVDRVYAEADLEKALEGNRTGGKVFGSGDGLAYVHGSSDGTGYMHHSES